jgi:7-cyano-7-deazaguanine synthase
MVDLGPVFAGLSPLTDKSREVGRYASADLLPGGLEDTFVPCRNMMFLTLAANRAYVLGASAIIIGVSQEDYGGYPDCRESFLTAAQAALNLGLDRKLEIIAPLVHRTKRDTVELATELDGALEALGYSHTCYAGEFPPCGHCHACLLRQRGFTAAGIRDPLVVRAQGALA